jgi:tetratricopeptide (TPR) repeat protein
MIVEPEGSPGGDGAALRPAAFRHPIGLAWTAFRAGRVDEAEGRIRAVLNDRPGHPDALHLLGIIALHCGHERPAAEFLGRAVEIDPNHAAFHSDLGNALHACGELDEALRAFSTAVRLAPDSAHLHFNLGNALNLKGRPEAALPAYRQAIAIEPGNPVFHNNLGNTLQELQRLDDAAQALERAVALDPRYVDAHYNLGLVLEAQEDFEAAIGAYRKVLALEPGHLAAQLRFVERLLLSERRAEALAAAEAGLAIDALNVNAMVMKATVLAALDDRDAERAFVDFDRLIWRTTLGPADGYASLEAFNRALADHVRSHPTLVVDPPDRTTRSGKQSGDLLDEPLGPMGPWAECIRAAVKTYLTQLPRDADHPYLARRPTRWRLSAWGVVLSRHGHQLPHTHPSGWVSGVYYVKVPEAMHDPARKREGWIEFGRPDPRYTCVRNPRVKVIEPAEGLVLLFPSYLWHGTVPFDSSEERISIAFDVYPEAWPTN